MANEIQSSYATGNSLYAIIRDPNANAWNTSTSAFETFSNADWSNYKVTLTEQGTSGYYVGNFPTGITQSGLYSIAIYAGSGSESDAFVSGGDITWTGTGESYSPSGTALTTLSYVKDFGGITVTTYDGYLQNRINSASVLLQNLLNCQFALQNYTEYYDGPCSTTLLLRHRPITSITSVTVNVQCAQPTVLASSDIVFNATKGTISVNPQSTQSPWFPYDWWSAQSSIEVVYSAGYAAIPFDVQDVVSQAVIKLFRTQGADLTMTGEKYGSDYSYTRKQQGLLRIFDDEMLASVWQYHGDFAV